MKLIVEEEPKKMNEENKEDVEFEDFLSDVGWSDKEKDLCTTPPKD